MGQQAHRKNHNEPHHAHELTFSCYNRFCFLTAERTCEWLADALEESRVVLNFRLWAYVFMPDHAHLIIHPREVDYDIARIRQAIKAPVGRKAVRHIVENAPRWLPRITRRRGKKLERLFWQSGGGHDRNIVESNALLNMIDYIHMNPVRGGFVERAEQWKWSSAAWYLTGAQVPIAPDAIPPEWLIGA